ncbi:site-specific tyrosine recombinase/integron integrase [Kordia algicida OT-1]|uniref:Tyrosine type site-specific recombinase n=1 Tax=Kordia algicida OT-1 TaxID=391587 RepID=A9DNU9_9FLAO|nr:site-specific tyrosine recombinase/integron integrase [Kordia algicida]EDP97283.1 tyrosine type site-specific recombinase [Kordia algicida OT-1]
MKVTAVFYRNKYWYEVEIHRTDKRIELIKTYANSKWSQKNKKWLFPKNEASRTFLKSIARQSKKEVTFIILKGNRLRITCHPTQKGIKFIKSLSYYYYNSAYKHWTIPYTEINTDTLESILENNYKINYIDKREKRAKKSCKTKVLREHQRDCPNIVIDKLKALRYSESTIKIYKSFLSIFFTYHYAYEPQEITNEMIRTYMRYLVQEREISESYQNQMINAIKFYYEKVLGGKQQTYFIDRPKRSKPLPIVLSQKETIQLLKSIPNLKHKTILTVIYSCGLRVSELIDLKLSSIYLEENKIHIVAGKGKKDRYVTLAVRTKKLIKIYIKKYAPEHYLIEGQKGGKYATSSIQKFIKKYSNEAGLTKNVTPHTLRHSFATHLLEKGISLRYIQYILGHQNSKTTEIYTHITQTGIENIKNPLDDFDFK